SASILTTLFLFFNTPPPTHTYTLSLHDALPISPCSPSTPSSSPACTRPPTRPCTRPSSRAARASSCRAAPANSARRPVCSWMCRSEEHTSELQSRENLVCRLLLEKKNKKKEE